MADDAAESLIEEVVENLVGFVDAVVLPLEKEHASLLDDPRQIYDERGAYSSRVKALKATVRTASAEAGYYNMFVPESIGGGGFGAYALYRAWEALYHRYGPARLLPYASIAHWSYGPSILCTHLSAAAAGEMLGPLMAGEVSACRSPTPDLMPWQCAPKRSDPGTIGSFPARSSGRQTRPAPITFSSLR
jgi:acyl-CoA dehydrogenase